MQTGTARKALTFDPTISGGHQWGSSLGGKDRRGSTYQPVPGVKIAKSCTEVGGCESHHNLFLLPMNDTWNFTGQDMQSGATNARKGLISEVML